MRSFSVSIDGGVNPLPGSAGLPLRALPCTPKHLDAAGRRPTGTAGLNSAGHGHLVPLHMKPAQLHTRAGWGLVLQAVARQIRQLLGGP